VLLALRRYEDAIRNFEALIALKPEDPNAWNNRGSTLVLLQKTEEAIAALKTMEHWKPSDWKIFYSLLEDTTYKTKATYALHAYVNQVSKNDKRNEFIQSLKKQIKKAKTVEAKITLQEELKLLTSEVITNERNAVLPSIKEAVMEQVNTKNGVQQLLDLQDKMLVAKNPIEQKRIIAEAARIPGFTSLTFISAYLDNEAVNKEAAVAVTR
jgi:tetratricopeptide (TPR) repeat protein